MQHHLEFELAEYLRSYGSVAGIRSVHGTLVSMALSGAYGASPRAPEDAWDEHRRARVRSCGVIASALRTLQASARDVLIAALAPVEWKRVVEQRFGKGKPYAELQKRFGDRIGLALLTGEVQRGFARERDRTAPTYGPTVREVREESDGALRGRLKAAFRLPEGAEHFGTIDGPMLDAAGALLGIERDIKRLDAYHFELPAPDGTVARDVVWNTPLGWLVTWAIVDDKKLRAERDAILGKAKAEASGLYQGAMRLYARARGVDAPEFDEERREREKAEREADRAPRAPVQRRAHKPDWFKNGGSPPAPRSSAEVEVLA